MPDDRKTGLKHAFDPENFRSQGHRMVDRLADYLRDVKTGAGPALLPIEPEKMLECWDGRFPSLPDGDVFPLVEQALDQSQHLHHPHFLGHQQNAPLPFAAIAGLAAELLNNGSAVYEMGPVNTVMEKRLIQWMAGLIGFSETADGFFTSGGTLGNLTALLAARQAKAGHDIWTDGVCGDERLTVLVSDQSHYSVTRAVRILGLGEAGLVTVPTGSDYKLHRGEVETAWRRAKEQGRRPFALAAGACSTAAGVYDPLSDLADFCAERDLWLHVDAAHGASALLTEKYRNRLAGVERADSVVWDAHKTLLMPALITAVLFREGDRSYEAFSQQASYLFEKQAREEWYNSAQRTMECTKLMMGFRLYLSLKAYGTRLFADYVTTMYDRTLEFADMVAAAPDFELPVQPESNILCFRYRPAGCENLDATQRAARRRLLERGDFYIVQTDLRDGLYLRCTVVNPWTTGERFQALMDSIRGAG